MKAKHQSFTICLKFLLCNSHCIIATKGHLTVLLECLTAWFLHYSTFTVHVHRILCMFYVTAVRSDDTVESDEHLTISQVTTPSPITAADVLAVSTR